MVGAISLMGAALSGPQQILQTNYRKPLSGTFPPLRRFG
jgi:hypothetical protein